MDSQMETDEDKRNLDLLLKYFGSVVSREDIASAYSQSGHKLYNACNILCSLQRSTTKSSALSSEEELKSTIMPSVCSSDNSLEITEATKSKPRKSSASLGTVSSVIGRGYVKPKVSTNESTKIKPMKLNSDEFPASVLWDEKDVLKPTPSRDTMHQDIEEFLFKMLGTGFSLDKSVIQDIVGQCGYDVTKSMDKLLDLSASKLEKSDDILEVPFGQPMDANLKTVPMQYEAPYTSSGSLKHNLETRSIRQPPDVNKKYDLEKEILGSLFSASVSVRYDEESKRCYPPRNIRRSASGQVVDKPLKEVMVDYRSVIERNQVIENDKDEREHSYEDLRKAVMEYWRTMREYYKAAGDAFANGDHEKAQKLMEEGHFFMKKAREADEKSAQKLLESNNEEEVFFDLLDFEPKEAMRFLEVQFSNLPGIPSIKHLKIRLGNEEENAKAGHQKRRKRLITNFLHKEDIKWTEEENGWIYVISLGQIDREKLSFASKMRC